MVAFNPSTVGLMANISMARIYLMLLGTARFLAMLWFNITFLFFTLHTFF